MINSIIAIILIFFFLVVIAVTVWSCIRLQKFGLLKLFLQGKCLAGMLSVLFIIQFLICGVALLVKTDWAVPTLRYTIYPWLVYVWIYGLKKLADMVQLLKFDKAKSISQLMGRSKFFDQLIEKTIAISKAPKGSITPNPGDGQAKSDSDWEAMLNDEALYAMVLQVGLQKKIKRKVIGLLVHTLIFVVILLLLG